MMPVLLTAAVLIGLVGTPAGAAVQERTLAEGERALIRNAAAIYVEVESSTWRPRGRVSFAIGPSVRAKLRAAGFAVRLDEREPHDLTLKVFYREERGRQFRADLYETDVHATLSLLHPTLGVLLLVRVDESSSDAGVTNAPYVDVLHKIEGNPSFYFFGDLVRGYLSEGRDAPATLIRGAERLLEDEEFRLYPHADTAALSGEMLAGPEFLYGTQALERAARELGALREARATPLLTRLLHHHDRQLRLAAVAALAQLQDESARPALEHLAEQDTSGDVRAAAAEALARMPLAAPAR
jgi:hypothetical protein